MSINADLHPTKRDIDAVFKKLKSQQSNKVCFDCGANNPTWASVSYGVYLCIDCAAVHRSLGVHISFIRSIQLDTSWSWLQLRAMQVGGNSNALNFFRQHGGITSDAQRKYHSRAAQLYKSKIEQLAKQAMKHYGTKLHIEPHFDSTSPDGQTKDVDFFEEHADVIEENFRPMSLNRNDGSSNSLTENGSISIPRNNSQRTLAEEVGEGQGPKVDDALAVSPSKIQDSAPKSKIIGAKKPAGKAKAGKKGGLGATRVQTNFADIESEASQRDKEAENTARIMSENQANLVASEERKLASMRLAYQDITVARQQAEKQWKDDPKKAEQAERLGMGVGNVQKDIGHSAFTDMKVIEQATPSGKDSTSIFDSPLSRRDPVDDFFGDSWIKKSSSGTKLSSWEMVDNPDKGLPDSDWSTTLGSSQKTFDNDSQYGRSRRPNPPPASSAYQGDEAQKKYGNAKSLSSDMFQRGDNDDSRSNLSRFDGATALGSDDLFGNGTKPRNESHYTYYDVQDIKDGVRQGVSKVAGKLSSIATAAYSSVQDRYN